MKVDFALLADGADAIGGKIYVLGGSFDTIWAQKVPAIHPKLSFVLRMLFDVAELDRTHSLEVVLMDEDGKSVAKVAGPLEIKRNSQTYKGWQHSILTVLNFVNLTFPKAGDYSFNVVCNNNTLASIPLRIALATQTNIISQ